MISVFFVPGYPQRMQLQRRRKKLFKSSEFEGVWVFAFCMTLVDINNIANRNTVSKLLQTHNFKIRVDQSSTVRSSIAQVATFAWVTLFQLRQFPKKLKVIWWMSVYTIHLPYSSERWNEHSFDNWILNSLILRFCH